MRRSKTSLLKLPFVVTRPSPLVASANTETSRRKREKPLVPRVDFSNHLGKSKYEVQSIGRLEISGVRFQCLIGKWTSGLVRAIGNFENRVFEKSGYYCTLILLTRIQLTLITK